MSGLQRSIDCLQLSVKREIELFQPVIDVQRQQAGGRAEAYLDGKQVGQIDAYIVERTNDNDLWHTYGLTPGVHTLKIVTRGTADPRSNGKKIVIERPIAYRAR